MVSNIIPYMMVFDAHAGWEVTNHGGKKVVTPTHSAPAWSAAVEFARDFRPKVLVFGGDQVNCAPISHHNDGKPGKVDGPSFKDELDLAADVLIQPLIAAAHRSARIIWHRGNHERWFDDLIDKMPALRGMTSIEKSVGLPKRTEVYSYGETSTVGKCHVMHGENVRGNVHPAKWALLNYQRSVRFGHRHTLDVHTMSTPVDVSDAKTAICVPALANPAMPYANNKPNHCLNGWLYGYLDESTGNFFDYPVVMSDGVACVEGKVYGG